MKASIRKGLGFGLTSGIITTLGLIVGINSGTHSKILIIYSILVIAIADSLSDSLGIHISEEAGRKNLPKRELWESTLSTLIFKLFFTLSFIVIIFFLELNIAIIASVIYGLLLLAFFSYYIAEKNNTSPTKAVLEHLLIAIFVITLTHFLGRFFQI